MLALESIIRIARHPVRGSVCRAMGRNASAMRTSAGEFVYEGGWLGGRFLSVSGSANRDRKRMTRLESLSSYETRSSFHLSVVCHAVSVLSYNSTSAASEQAEDRAARCVPYQSGGMLEDCHQGGRAASARCSVATVESSCGSSARTYVRLERRHSAQRTSARVFFAVDQAFPRPVTSETVHWRSPLMRRRHWESTMRKQMKEHRRSCECPRRGFRAWHTGR